MKTILFLILFLNITSLFGMDKPPVSVQKVNNAVLTCPNMKWCRVQVSVSMAFGYVSSGGGNDLTQITTTILGSAIPQSSSLNETFNIDLKSNETLNCLLSTRPTNNLASGLTYTWRPYIVCNISGEQFYKKYINLHFIIGTGTPTFNNYFSVASDYSFYSMEYFN